MLCDNQFLWKHDKNGVIEHSDANITGLSIELDQLLLGTKAEVPDLDMVSL